MAQQSSPAYARPTNDQVLADANALLGRLTPFRVDLARHPDGQIKGFLNLERTTGSVTNTAAVLDLARRRPSLVDGLTAGEDRAWIDRWIAPAMKAHRAELSGTNSDAAMFAAYRLAQLVRVNPDPEIVTELGGWLARQLEQSLLRRDTRPLHLFFVHLVVGVLDHRRDEPLRRLVMASAETCTLQQTVLGLAGLWTDFDAVDLGLALTLGRSSALASRISGRAVSLLNEAASIGRAWRNQQLLLRLGDRTVGCSAFYAARALLAAGDNFEDLLPAYAAHLEWLSEHMTSFGPPSDLFRREGLVEPWFHCLAIDFVVQLRERLMTQHQAALRSAYRVEAPSRTRPWSEAVLEPDDIEAVQRSVIEPRRGSQGVSRPGGSVVLLFGPPGTAKTTLARMIAAEISWPLISVEVADFLRGGFDDIFGRASQIFADLMHLDDVVVLLDEVEQVFSDRERGDVDVRQKLLTASLLPPLQRLRDRGRAVVVIATNHVLAFDAAIIRPGRVDLVVPVGPPNQAQRARLLRSAARIPPDVAEALAGLVDRFTIGELLGFGALTVHPGVDPGTEAKRLLDEYKRKHPHSVLDEKDMKKHESLAARYRRLA